LATKIPLRAIVDLARFILHEDIDIIHAHTLKMYLLAGLINTIARKKLIFNYHGVFITSEYYSRIERWVLSFIHWLITVCGSVHMVAAPSHQSRKMLLSTSKFPVPILTYYNGCALNGKKDFLNPAWVSFLRNLSSTHELIAYVGRLETEKRVDGILEIADIMRTQHPRVCFVVIGDGSCESALRRLCSQCGLDEYVRFVGFVEHAAMYFSFFKAIVLASDREGMPLVVWEAMGQGIPIVATDVGGISEIVAAEDCGLIYKKNDWKHAADLLHLILADADYGHSLGNRGKEAIRTKYTIGQFSKTFAEIYESLAVS
jgi:glycosyltransferase involved in cell wall biosynthesis